MGIFTVGTLGVCTGVTKVGTGCWVTGGDMGIIGANPRVLFVGIILPALQVSEKSGKQNERDVTCSFEDIIPFQSHFVPSRVN